MTDRKGGVAPGFQTLSDPLSMTHADWLALARWLHQQGDRSVGDRDKFMMAATGIRWISEGVRMGRLLRESGDG